MDIQLATFIRNSPDTQRIGEIFSNCVHCGMCTATCPTYQLLGDELDGPRGRIYQIKHVLEGGVATRTTQQHLDRCLSCLNCETTCPSGVRYGQLLEIGKTAVSQQVKRPWLERIYRTLILSFLPYHRRMGALLGIARIIRPLLPVNLKEKIPPVPKLQRYSVSPHTRKMLMLSGCVQNLLSPNINASTERVFDRLGITLIATPPSQCCGSISFHNDEKDTALDMMRRNIDTWYTHLKSGCTGLVVNASGCGALIKEYGDIFRHDLEYIDKARYVSNACQDIAEVLQHEDLLALAITPSQKNIAFHPPCTLQHAQKQPHLVEGLLSRLGFSPQSIANKHLCCGSAGTYSLFQPDIAKALRDDKLTALQASKPNVIASANIGCIHHLQSGTKTPVLHWIELIDQTMQSTH